MKLSTGELLAFFSQFLLERGVEVSEAELPNFNFVASGLLDSFEILSMVMQLETEFQIGLSPEELGAEENATVGGVMATLLDKVQQ